MLALKSNLQSMSICTDCTPEYQAKMTKLARCEAPEVNVRLLQLRELENDVRREIIETKLETFNDPWANMLVGLEHAGSRPPAPIRSIRIKKDNNEPTV